MAENPPLPSEKECSPIENQILIIDDDQAALKAIEYCLIKEGYATLTASNGKEGLEAYRKNLPTVILLDLNMPIMSGLEFLEEMGLTTLSPCSVIVLSALQDLDTLERCYALGASAFLRKPFENIELIGQVGHAVALKKAQRRLEEEVEERKRIEKRWVKSEKKYRDLVETSQNLIWIIDVEGRFTYLNRAWETLLGYTTEEMISKPFSLYEKGEVIKGLLKDHDNFKKRGPTTLYETTLVTRSGREVNLLFNAIALNKEDGGLKGIQGIGYDISARKRAMEALQESEKKYRTLTDNALVGVYMSTMEGDLFYINRALLKILECHSLLEVQEKKILPFENPEGIWQNILDTLFKEGKISNFEFSVETGQGNRREMLLSATLRGEVITGMAMDISKHKKMEHELSSLLDISQDISTTLDLADLLDRAVKKAVEVTEADLAQVFFLEEGGMVSPRSVYRKSGKEALPPPFSLEKRPTLKRVIENQIPLFTPDTLDPETQSEEERETARRYQIVSSVLVPLIIRERTVGVISFCALEKKRRFTASDISFYTTIANQLSAMIAHAELYEEAREAQKNLLIRGQQLEVLLRTSLQINQVLEIDVIMRTLVTSAIELVGALSGFGGQIIDGKMAFTEYHHQGEITEVHYSFEKGEGVSGRVMETHKPYFSNRAKEDPQVLSSFRESLGFERVINVPLFNRKGELLGCIEIYDKKGGLPFGENDLHLLQGLSASAVTALENAQMLEFHKKAEKALLESEERFRKIFEQNEDAIILFKYGTAQIVDVNPTAVKLYGYEKEELIGNGPALFFPADKESHYKKMISAADSKRGFRIDKIPNIRKDGKEIMVAVRGKVVKLRDRSVVYSTFRDITENIRLEEEAREIQSKLIQANKMTSLGMLVSGVAHEINNPNNFIMGNAKILTKAWNDAIPILQDHKKSRGEFTLGGLPFSEMNSYMPALLQGISEGGGRIKAIIDNLKNFGRQQGPLLDSIVDIGSVIHTSALILRDQIHQSTNHFEIDSPPDTFFVRGSSQQIEQVLINLMANGLQALPTKESGLKVSTRYNTKEKNIVIEVKDEGIGMDETTLEHTFDPFFTTRLNSGGTGLGLSISYSIIKEHKGVLELKSQKGKGTTATITLPAIKEEKG